VVTSERYIASGVTALLAAASPLLVALLGFVAFRQRPGVWQLTGMALGLAGLVVLTHPWGGQRLEPLGVVAALLSAVFWSSGSVYASRATLPTAAPVAASLQMLFGSAGLLVMALLGGEPAHVHLQTASGRSLLALLYLVLFGSLLAFTAYAWLVRTAPLSLVFTYVYVNPVVAVALGALVVGEPITTPEILGGVIILLGVAIIVTGQAAARRRWQTGTQ
jgi:drug/metabolite transporter (DMT)-like permease